VSATREPDFSIRFYWIAVERDSDPPGKTSDSHRGWPRASHLGDEKPQAFEGRSEPDKITAVGIGKFKRSESDGVLQIVGESGKQGTTVLFP
jgi:hypothetical protein